MRQSIIILGAGLLGRLLAYSLAKKNYQVAVFEKSPLEHQQSAAYAAAAMLAPLAESVSCELPIVHMGFYSLTRWPTIIEELDSNIFFSTQWLAHHLASARCLSGKTFSDTTASSRTTS